MKCPGPNNKINAPIASANQIFNVLKNWIPLFIPVTAEIVTNTVKPPTATICVTKLSGTPKILCNQKLNWKPKNPIVPIVPATAPKIQKTSVKEPILLFSIFAPNTGYNNVRGLIFNPLL